MVKTTYLPTPHEIRERAAEVQASWTDSERRRRLHGRYGGGPVEEEHWQPPVFAATMLPLAPDLPV